MSKSTDPEFDLELHFLPAWAQQSTDTKRFENYKGEPDRGESRGRQGAGRPGGRRPGPAGGGDRPRSGGTPGPRGRGRPFPDRGERAERGDRRPQAEPESLPELNVAFVPDDHGVDSLARQIRMTGRAYPLFDIARMVMQKSERHSVTISVVKNAEGQPKQPLFTCAIDDTVWLSEDDAVQHVLGKHFNLFYQPERTEVAPPKGTYTFVAQCGMSGVILGPPNYHDYQNQLRKLHTARFSRMPFDVFKARVKIVKDEVVVKKWLEDQSFTTEYQCLNLPEPLKLPNREEVEKHFRATHLANIIRPVETVSLKGAAARDIRTPALFRLIRSAQEDQRRFPLQVATVLSQQFAARSLQFFKVKKTVTHVAVARPHYLDLETIPVSEGVKKIVQFIDSHPGCTRKLLFDYFLPNAVRKQPAAPGAEPAPETAAQESSAEETALITDLHWLIHQGHVIEFADGLMETAKKPLPKPSKPAASPKKDGAAAPTQTSTGDSSEAAAGLETPSASPTAETSAQADPERSADISPSPSGPAAGEDQSIPTSGVVAESTSVAVSPAAKLPEPEQEQEPKAGEAQKPADVPPAEDSSNPEVTEGESTPVSGASLDSGSSESGSKPA